jgi:hypothetical protein
MATSTAIEWTDTTWTPVTGCTKISAGCDNCYAERFSERFRGVQGHPFENGFDLQLRQKLRGKQIVRRIGHTRRYEPLPTGLRAMTALLVLRNKAIKPLLAAAQPLHPARGAHNPKPIDAHYYAIKVAMKGVFHELGLAA